MHTLTIQDLSVNVEGRRVIEKINLTVNQGEVHVVMGPNGSGKSSLALTLMGHPRYKVEQGLVMVGRTNLFSLKPDQRAKKGLFLSFQNPIAVPGVTLGQFVFSAHKSIRGDSNIKSLYSQIKRNMAFVGLDKEMLERDVNDGFSGGERKKVEMFMLLSLAPKFAIFDEIDSGLDVDTLKKFAEVIKRLLKKRTAIILITHNQKILKVIKPDLIHILKEGRIVKSGNRKLAAAIERLGYAKI